MTSIRLARQCHECPLVKTCKHKKLETMEYLLNPIISDNNAQVLRETVSRVVDGKVVTMYKDELEKILYKDLYSHLGLQFGG